MKKQYDIEEKIFQFVRKKGIRNDGLRIHFLYLVLGFFILTVSSLHAQPTDSAPSIGMEEAIDMAMANYPQIKTANLEIQQQQSLKKTAWELGNTQVYTSGEEIGESGQGVYTTIGIQQQNMEIFGIVPKIKAQKERIALSEAALNLDKIELRQEVKYAYAEAYVASKNLQLYVQLDSIYQDFQRAAEIRYEVEDISKLAFLAASNQVKQISLQKKQIEFDYATALNKLNLWLVSDTFYTVSTAAQESWQEPIVLADSITEHPLLQIAEQKVNVANAEKKVATADFYPKLNAQYGKQEIAEQSGFYQYQLGVSIPLFFFSKQGQVQSAKIQTQIAEQEYRQTQYEVQANYQSLIQQYKKWLSSWRFYENEALPLVREQREGAVLAFKEGAIEYTSFIQNLKETLQVEMDAQKAFQQYLDAKFKLEYYSKLSNY